MAKIPLTVVKRGYHTYLEYEDGTPAARTILVSTNELLWEFYRHGETLSCRAINAKDESGQNYRVPAVNPFGGVTDADQGAVIESIAAETVGIAKVWARIFNAANILTSSATLDEAASVLGGLMQIVGVARKEQKSK